MSSQEPATICHLSGMNTLTQGCMGVIKRTYSLEVVIRYVFEGEPYIYHIKLTVVTRKAMLV